MALSKKIEDSKKDMNFFSEFGGAGGQVSSYMSLILIIFIGFLVIAGAIYGVFFLQAFTVQSQINALNAKMEEPGYVQALNEHAAISDEIKNLNVEYYEISYLYSNIQSLNKVDSAYMDVITKNLPSDICLTGFNYSGGSIIVSGTSNTYMAPLDLLASLSRESLFSRTEIVSITQNEEDTAAKDLDYLYLSKYNFSISCSIKEDYSANLYHMVDDVATIPLSSIETTQMKVGDVYSKSGINTFTTLSGETYTLSRIIINTVQVTEEEFAAIVENDSFSLPMNSDMNIMLYYKLQTEVVS